MALLSESEISAALKTLPVWTRVGDSIRRVYQFKDFPASIAFVNGVAKKAETEWHHPDIDIRWNKVTLTLSTHDEGGLTEKDFSLAQAFDELAG